MFGKCWSWPREPLMKQQRVVMNEPKGNKFGETASLKLNFAQQQELIHPMFRRLDMPVHQRGSRTNTASVCCLNDLQPLRGRELVCREDVTEFIVLNFG